MDLAIRALNLGLGAARLGVRISFGVVRTAVRIVGLDHEQPTSEYESAPVRTQPAPARPAPVRVEQPGNGRVEHEDFGADSDSEAVFDGEAEAVFDDSDAAVDDAAEAAIDNPDAAVDDAAEATIDAAPASAVDADGEAVIDGEPVGAPADQAPPTGGQPEPVPSPLDDEEPVHVDDEPELVAEFAEPGAEEGAHAELRVDPPWPAYASMKVADIRERVAVADAAELAVVQLFESTHRNRKSILDAVERRSRELANSPSAR